jgi:predicted nucleotidyltransferase
MGTKAAAARGVTMPSVPEPTEHLRASAKRIVEAALDRVALRAALLTGSAGRGDADFYSDIDLFLYVDELPSEGTLDEIREGVGGTEPLRKSPPTEHFSSLEFTLHGVRTEVSFTTLARVEWRIEQLLERLEEIDSPRQKNLAAILEGLPLYGEEVIERWRARVRNYPEPLRRAMVERYWNFFPLWYESDALTARDAELWRVAILVESAFNPLGVLAGLNRLYFNRFELKRMRALTTRMALAPPRLADRLESLFRLEPEAAAEELGRLVEETLERVARELPDLELPLAFPVGTRKHRWCT